MELQGSSAHKSTPLVPVQSQINPVHDLLSHLFMIHIDITFPSMPRLFKQSFSYQFSRQNPVSHLCPPQSYPPWCYHPNNIMKLLLLTQCLVCSLMYIYVSNGKYNVMTCLIINLHIIWGVHYWKAHYPYMQVGAITSSLMYNCSVLSNLGTVPAKESHLSCAVIASFT